MSGRWKFIAAGVAIVVVLAAALALLARTDADIPFIFRRADPQGSIVVAYPAEPATLDPYAAEGDAASTRDLLRPVLPTLLNVDPNVTYSPGLSTRVPEGDDITFDPFTVTHHLAEDAVWSDGTPITADDVVFTWEVIKDAGDTFPGAGRYRALEDIEVADPKTLRLVFSSPYRGWEDLFSAGDYILPRHILEGQDVHARLAPGPRISGGPFIISEVTSGLEVVYQQNSAWWGPSALSEEVRVQFVPLTEIALRLMKDGRSDVLARSSQPNLTRRIERAGGTALSAYGADWWELGFNLESRGANEFRERQAMAHDIDRASMVEAFVRQQGRALQTIPSPADGDHFDGLAHDPDEAASLRRQTGGIVPLAFSIPDDDEMARLFQRAMQTALDEAGIQVDNRNPAVDLFYGSWLRQGSFDLAMWERRESPRGTLWLRFHSDAKAPVGRNLSRISDANLDEALDALDAKLTAPQATLTTDALRVAVLERLTQTLPVIPLFEAKAFIGYRDGIEGPIPNATIDGPFWNLYDWSGGKPLPTP